MRAGYVAKELEGLAAEPAAELVRDDEDGVALGGRDIIPASVLVVLHLVSSKAGLVRGGVDDLVARGRAGANVDVLLSGSTFSSSIAE